MDNHALLSDAYDIAQSLALARRNPWAKLSTKEEVDTKIEIAKHLRSKHADKILEIQKPAHTFMAFASVVQYFVYGIGLSVWILIRNADAGSLWGIFLFYAPVLTLCMNYCLFRMSPSVRKYRSFVRNLD
jgi:predicted membrane channel-forming protein YqfA (hemolysin III family)